MSSLKPAYLIRGTDTAKINEAVDRLRQRAERDDGPGALEVIRGDAQRPPDPASVMAAIDALSLITSHRYLLTEGAEAWNAAQSKQVAAALGQLPPDLTIVLVAKEGAGKRDAKVAKSLVDAVEKVGGILGYEMPKAAEMPAWLRTEARRRGFELSTAAARILVERMGESTVRLGNELDRLSLWVGVGAEDTGGLPEVTESDLELMVADTSEEAVWTLADAIVDRAVIKALIASERSIAQDDALTPVLYMAAKKLREASRALAIVEAGGGQGEVQSALKIHPYAAKLLVQRVRRSDSLSLRRAACAIADLEWWTRGGSDYSEQTALTLSLRRALGASR